MRRIRSSVFFSGHVEHPRSSRMLTMSQWSGLGAGPCHAAVAGDDVAADDYQQVFAHGARRQERLFEPVPFFIHDVGIAAVGIRIEIVGQNRVGAERILAGAAGRFERPECAERRAGRQGEFAGRPFARLAQVAVVGFQQRVLFEGFFIGFEQPFGVVVAVRYEQYVAFSAREHEIHHAHEYDRRLGQLARPRQHVVQLAMRGDAPDRPFLKRRERITGILGEEEGNPHEGIALQLLALLLPFDGREPVDGIIPFQCAVILAPFPPGLSIL